MGCSLPHKSQRLGEKIQGICHPRSYLVGREDFLSSPSARHAVTLSKALLGSQSPARRPIGAFDLVRSEGDVPWLLPFPPVGVSIFHFSLHLFCTTPAPFPFSFSSSFLSSSPVSSPGSQSGARPLSLAEPALRLSVAAERRFRKCALRWRPVEVLAALPFF